ncbi:MAG: BLUF domain-containing protein, partial [Variovorax sp.]
MTELREILFYSVLASDQSPIVVGQIVAAARARNMERGITGLLVFDGLRFCQHMEGPRDEVLRLMTQIAADARHAQIRVVYEGMLAQRRYLRFEMGLAEVENGEDLANFSQLAGAEALAHFLALR